MKIKQIKYGMRKGKPDAEFGRTPVPKKITVELSLAEITYLSKLIGKQSWNSAEEVAPGVGGAVTSNIYDGCCEVLNASFYSGDDDAVRYVQRRRKS